MDPGFPPGGVPTPEGGGAPTYPSFGNAKILGFICEIIMLTVLSFPFGFHHSLEVEIQQVKFDASAWLFWFTIN